MHAEMPNLPRIPHGQSLTRRERQLLKLLVEGCTNAQIGTRLNLGTQTVKNQMTVLMEKAHVKNRVQLAVYAVRSELIT
jgi:DNA-binding NarL/FixJ family response regulator